MYFWLTSSRYEKTTAFLQNIATQVNDYAHKFRDWLFANDIEVLDHITQVKKDIQEIRSMIDEIKKEIAAIEPTFMKIKMF
jgi:archaellum component FlaC